MYSREACLGETEEIHTKVNAWNSQQLLTNLDYTLYLVIVCGEKKKPKALMFLAAKSTKSDQTGTKIHLGNNNPSTGMLTLSSGIGMTTTNYQSV